MLTGGPDKVRFKKNSQIRCTLAKAGLEKVCGSRRREVVFRVAISRGLTCFFSVLFLGPVAEGPPERYVNKKLGSKTVWIVFFSVSAFLVVFRTFLRPKTRTYTFSSRVVNRSRFT